MLDQWRHLQVSRALRLPALLFLVLLVSSCSQNPAVVDPETAARNFVSSFGPQDSADKHPCGLSDAHVFGKNADLPFGAGKAEVTNKSSITSVVTFPIWCSGRTSDGDEVRRWVYLSVDAKLKSPTEYGVGGYSVIRTETLAMWRQTLPWAIGLLVAPLIVYSFAAGFLLMAAFYSGSLVEVFQSLQSVRTNESFDLRELPTFLLVIFRLATLGLVGWMGLNYFGSWLAVLISVLCFVALGWLVERPYAILVLSILMGIAHLALRLMYLAWQLLLPGLGFGLSIWAAWNRNWVGVRSSPSSVLSSAASAFLARTMMRESTASGAWWPVL
jgi:hypothetical protein